MKKSPMYIGVLGFDDVNALDLTGPLEAFANANELEGGDDRDRWPYRLVVIGVRRGSFTAESGVMFRPHCELRGAPPLDTLIVPGGRGLREKPAVNAAVVRWIVQRAPRMRRVVSVCTGIFGIAPTGLLDGRCVTTHWRQAPLLARQYPALRVNSNALFLRDGKFYTGGGITAGIDLALALIEEDRGPRAALAVAREMVVYLKRPGGQEQYSEPLRAQTRASDRFADIVAWIDGHLDADLSVEALAQRACLMVAVFAASADAPAPDTSTGPAYTVDGKLLPPLKYREWIFLSSGLDMSYSESGALGTHRFDNVFAEPVAYRAFLATGTCIAPGPRPASTWLATPATPPPSTASSAA